MASFRFSLVTRWQLSAAALASLLALGLVACGDDGQDADDSSSGTSMPGDTDGDTDDQGAGASSSTEGGDGDSSSGEVMAEELDGVWLSRGYGYALDIGEGRARLLEVTEISCVELQDLPISGFETLFDSELIDPDLLALGQDNSLAPYLFDREDSMPDACEDGPTPVVGDDGYEADALQAFDVVWQTFAEHYAFFKLRGVDWDAVGQEVRQTLSSSSSDEELFEAISALMDPLDDGHVSLTAGDEYHESGSVELIDILFAEFEAQTEVPDFETYANEQFGLHLQGIAGALDESPQGGGGTMMWGMLGGSVGYLAYFAFDPDNPDAELNELDAALEAFADADAMVVDLRYNEGGNDRYALDVASRFFDEERVVFQKSARDGGSLTEAVQVTLGPAEGDTFLGPVYVVTSNSTVSAAEVFTMSMAEAPHVVIAGQPSNGIFSDILERVLPNGWAFGLSNEVYTTAAGDVLEGAGVPVDLPITLQAFPLEDRQTGQDSWLDALRTEIEAAQ
ncbi:MAG: S41 family peptidase [Nannocystales bacterium]